MKIAIAAFKKDQNSEISSEAACRSSYFLIFDEKGTLLETLKNPFRVSGGDAGFGVAKMLEDKRISAVVAEKFGSTMIDTLEKWKIDHYEITGAVMDSIPLIKKPDELDA